MTDFTNFASFDPKVCISGKISRIARVTANIFRKYMSPFGVTNSQVSLLFILSKYEGLTQKRLAGIAQLEKSSLHRNLKNLVGAGYVKKSKFPQFEISVEGKKLVHDIIPEWEKAMGEIREILGAEGESAITEIHLKLITKEV